MKLFYFIFFIFLSHLVTAQNRHITDSLINRLALSGQDSNRAFLLSELAFQYKFSNTDSAMEFAQSALRLSRQLHHKRGETLALGNIAFLFREKGNLPLSMELHFKVLQMANDNHFNYEAALSLARLGNIYRDLRDYNLALYYQRQGLTIFKKAGLTRGLAIGTMLIGQTFQEMNQLDSALYYEDQARLMDAANYSDINTSRLNVTGRIYSKLKNYPLALWYYQQCATASTFISDYRSLSLVCTNIAQLYYALQNTDSAVFYADKALVTARKVSNKLGILNAATLLSQIYEPIEIRKSLEFYKIAVAAKDSLYGNEKLVALQTLRFNEQERKQNFETAKTTYKNEIKQYALLTGLAVFLVVALILYGNNRQKLKTNKSLEKTVADLKSTQAQLIQSEKMASLGELTAGIAHEIQNPLNFVNNFSDVNAELIEEATQEIDKGNISDAKQILNNIRENEQKINHHGKRADAIVKGMLQHSRSNSAGKEPTDINKLADEYLRLAYHGLRAKDSRDAGHKSFNATLKTDYDETIGNINIIPQDIGRVLLNLISNAFYAVNAKTTSTPNDYEPMVWVTTKKAGSKIQVQVADNGNGVPPELLDKIFQPFFTTKPTGQGTGLGLSLSYDIVKAHGGELKVANQPGKDGPAGAVFTMLLPAG